MSFCCGASMIGMRGTLRTSSTLIHHVPLLFCPVCQRFEVHHKAEDRYEMLISYAMDDQVPEMDFDALVRDHELDGLFDNCSDSMEEPPEEIVHNQIDMALDLMGVAEMFGDTEWQEELKTRLKSLARRQMELHKEGSKARPRLV
ncbi:MAG: hypothetical protein RLZZ267_272 [Bacillota bacterium]